MTPFSICIIAKNEEKHILPLFTSIQEHLKDYPHEIIFVDTGSTDNTKNLVSTYTNKIYDFTWVNDFSVARNFSISKASYDWILVLDCDEYITDFDYLSIDNFISHHPDGIGMITRMDQYKHGDLDYTYNAQIPRFFSRKYFHYEGIIHEQVVALNNSISQRFFLPLNLHHVGYIGTEEELRQKAQRNISLLKEALKENSEDTYTYFQLGQSYNSIHDIEKACFYYGKGLEYEVNPKLQYVQLMVIGYGYSLINLNRHEDALAFESIYDEFDSSADFVCLMGLIYLRNGFVLEAIREFTKATTMNNSYVNGSNSFIPTYNLGCIHEVLGEINDAVELYRKCGDFKPALERLAEIIPDSVSLSHAQILYK